MSYELCGTHPAVPALAVPYQQNRPVVSTPTHTRTLLQRPRSPSRRAAPRLGWPSSEADGRYAVRTGLTHKSNAAHTPVPCCAQNDEEEPDDYYAKNSETQKLLMRDQDDTLKMLGSAVDRVQSMARQVNQELSDQNQMLDTIDDEVDKTESKLASVHKSLKMLANDTDRGKYCVICLLIVLLVWLVMMVLD